MKNRLIANDQKLQALRALPLFEMLNDQQLEALGRVADRLTVRPGTNLAIQRGTATHLSIIVSGAASVSIDGNQVAVLGAGAYVGELAFADDMPSTATVTTIEPTTIWYIARAGLLPIWDVNPEMSTVLLREVTSKLRATDELVAARPAPVVDVADETPLIAVRDPR